jgi:hypothetical protein
MYACKRKLFISRASNWLVFINSQGIGVVRLLLLGWFVLFQKRTKSGSSARPLLIDK